LELPDPSDGKERQFRKYIDDSGPEKVYPTEIRNKAIIFLAGSYEHEEIGSTRRRKKGKPALTKEDTPEQSKTESNQSNPQKRMSERNDTLFIDPATSPNFAIFYNIYIPKKRDKDLNLGDEDNALRIIEEQLRQVYKSYAASPGPNQTTTIFYNTIGKGPIIDDDPNYMTDLCEMYKLRCQHMAHYDRGFEEVTLQRLYDFCQSHPTYRVVYMHSKGSYHNFQSDINERWRWHLTQAVLHKDCIQPPNETCNLCGLQYFPIPASFMPGNFFTSHCSYINKLLPPAVHAERLKGMYKEAIDLQTRHGLSTQIIYPPELAREPEFYGIGRFSSEHWVGSHPSVIPCDLSSSITLFYWRVSYRDVKVFDWGMAPRKGVSGPWMNAKGLKNVLPNETLRMRDYFLLPGRIFQWYYLYDETPSASSWIWDFYPDGKRWRECVERYGKDVVLKLTQLFAEDMAGANIAD